MSPGTVYVTQRTPGNLVMRRDTDGDGIADIQKIVVRQRQLHGIAIRGKEIFLADIRTIYASDIHLDGRIGPRRNELQIPPTQPTALSPPGRM